MKTRTLSFLAFAVALLALLIAVRPAHAQNPARPNLRILSIGARTTVTTTTRIINGQSYTFLLQSSRAIVFIRNSGNAASSPCKMRLEWRNWFTNALKRTFVVDVPAIPANTPFIQVDVLAFGLTDFADQGTIMEGFVDCAFQVIESNENDNFLRSGPGGILS